MASAKSDPRTDTKHARKKTLAVAPNSGCVSELGAQCRVRATVGYAPRADIILVVGFAVDRSGVDVPADLLATDAFVIG